MPKVVIEKGQLQLEGGAVIKNNKYHANLSPSQIEALNLLTGNVIGGVIDSRHDGHLFSYEVFSMTHRVRAMRQNGKYKFVVNANIKGRLSEDWYLGEDSFNDQYIKNIEKSVQKDIKKRVGLTDPCPAARYQNGRHRFFRQCADQFSEGVGKRQIQLGQTLQRSLYRLSY